MIDKQVAIKKVSLILLGDQDFPSDEFDMDAARLVETYLNQPKEVTSSGYVSRYMSDIFNDMYGYNTDDTAGHGFKYHGPEFETHEKKVINILQDLIQE